MKSHADEIMEEWEKTTDDGVQALVTLGDLYRYARDLEFALKCITKGTNLDLDSMNGSKCPHCTNPKPHIHRAAEERWANVLVTEGAFQTHFYGPHNPCNRTSCSVCFPKVPMQSTDKIA